jgi:Glycosyl hydrolase family 71
MTAARAGLPARPGLGSAGLCRARARGTRPGVRSLAAGLLVAIALLVAVAPLGPGGRAPAAAAAWSAGSGSGRPIPVLAYYYIWFNPTSWNRAKIDYPLAGRYSSDDTTVMRQQVLLAKRAGITGFMVSWKNTPVLNRRLANLRAIAAAAGFRLAIVFEGRDFHRRPLPMAQVRASFSYLTSHYAHDPVFGLFGKPLVMWSGTWVYSRRQLASITGVFGSRLLILASEKQVAAYEAVADLFNGNSYYWSSADPLHTPGYRQKLDEFSTAVHERDSLWIAPAAPGFDAKLVGGTRVIPRRGGQTLRLEMNAAMDSSPDAIGLISWNEYSENSEVEPSRAYGATALNVIASIEHAKPPAVADIDSSAPAGFHAGPSQFAILIALSLLLAGSIIAIVMRRGSAK